MTPLDLFFHVFLDHVHGHVPRALVHDLHSVFPSPGSQFSLSLELGKLSLVVGICDRTGPKTVPDGEGNVVGSHDLANLVPFLVEEVFLVMSKAPLGHDRSSPAHDTRHPPTGHGNVSQKYPCMDGKVINPLFSLLDQGIAKDFPRQSSGCRSPFRA